jgi:lipoprotein-anchoring transpeptidase ErfK/SrfK
MRLGTQTRWTHGPVKLLILDDRYDEQGRRWLRVRLPVRPNDADGWVDADYVRVNANAWRVTIATASRTVRVYRSGRLTRRFHAVVGSAASPTPHGLFAVSERARQPNPSGFIGPWALHLTAHSEVLQNYGGGPGRVALHGRSGASLADPLGSARSHGCIRVDNADIRRLARVVPLGTAVRIHD